MQKPAKNQGKTQKKSFSLSSPFPPPHSERTPACAMMTSSSNSASGIGWGGVKPGFFFGTRCGVTGYYADPLSGGVPPSPPSPSPSPPPSPSSSFTASTFSSFVLALSSLLSSPSTIASIAEGATFDDKRQNVLDIQMELLAEYGTVEDLQKLCEDPPSATVTADVAAMNTAVKDAYVSGILASRPPPEGPSSLSTTGLGRSELLEFLDGAGALVTHPTSKVALRAAVDRSERAPAGDRRSSPVQLMNCVLNELQMTMLECCGFDKDYGVEVLAGIRESYGDDGEVMGKLEVFQRAMEGAVKEALRGESREYSKVDDGERAFLLLLLPSSFFLLLLASSCSLPPCYTPPPFLLFSLQAPLASSPSNTPRSPQKPPTLAKSPPPPPRT